MRSEFRVFMTHFEVRALLDLVEIGERRADKELSGKRSKSGKRAAMAIREAVRKRLQHQEES